jgi:hypothetical protein
MQKFIAENPALWNEDSWRLIPTANTRVQAPILNRFGQVLGADARGVTAGSAMVRATFKM